MPRRVWEGSGAFGSVDSLFSESSVFDFGANYCRPRWTVGRRDPCDFNAALWAPAAPVILWARLKASQHIITYFSGRISEIGHEVQFNRILLG